MNRKHVITKEQLDVLVKKYKSVREVLMALGYSGDTGGGYERFYKLIKEYNIDISHFTGQLWNKGKNVHTDSRVNKFSKKEIFVENSVVSTKVVRRYLESDPNFIHRCVNCHNTEWGGQPIPLELDHINGINRDNRIENLRFICLNCHAQTHSFRGRNIKTPRNLVTDEQVIEAIKKCKNIRQVLIELRLTPKGGNYDRVNEILRKHKLKFHT